MDLQGFDASQVQEPQDYSAIPAGQYAVIATASEEKATKSGNGSYLQITFEVLDGPFKSRKLWSRLNLRNPNQTAVDIAQRELGAICRAVGVIKPTRSEELHNKPMLVEVDVEVSNEGKQGNVIKKYLAATGAAPQVFAPAAPATTPAAAPAAPSTPPWAKK